MKSKKFDTLGQFLSLPMFALDGIFYHLSGFLFTPRPKFVCFPVTFRCNSRCQMCNVWQYEAPKKEIDLQKIEAVFSNRLFKKVEEVVLHGGEPTIRTDIKDIYRIILECCPRIQNITSSTNGLNPPRVMKRVGEIISVADHHSDKLTFTVSIDGLKESHDKIRGVPGGFDRAIESLSILKKYQQAYPIQVKIITVIQPQNLQDLTKMQALAKAYDVDLIFQPLMIDTFYRNSSSDKRLQFSKNQYQEYRTFINTTLTKGKDTKSLYWKNFLKMMEGKRRSVPCAYDRYVLSLYPTGETLPCSKENWIRFGNVFEKPVDKIWFSDKSKKIRKKMKKDICPTCNFYCGAEYSLKKEFFVYATYYVKTTLGSLQNISKSVSKRT